MSDILEKIKKAGLIGRGGGCFPVADKWSAVAKAMADRHDRDKTSYVICNCSEGEPGVKKDAYIVEHFAGRVIDGMAIAINFLGAKKGIFYINHNYYKKYKKLLEKEIAKSGADIEIFLKPFEAGYIGGEETTALNVIEGKRAEPRLRPPFPPTSGLWDSPTLINNVETFYNVSLVDKNEYRNERFYTVSGDCLYEGVFKFAADLTIKKILAETHNNPKFPFFVQVGGDGSGDVFSEKMLDRPVSGAGSIHVYSLEKYQPAKLMLGWLNFFYNESCGQCTPCREGTYRLKEIFEKDDIDWKTVAEILISLSASSFCGLGSCVPVPVKSFVNNVLKTYSANKIKLPKEEIDAICACFN